MKKLLASMLAITLVLGACNNKEPSNSDSQDSKPEMKTSDSKDDTPSDEDQDDSEESTQDDQGDSAKQTEDVEDSDNGDSESESTDEGSAKGDLEWTSDYEPVYPIVEEKKTYNFTTSFEKITTGLWNGYWEDATNIKIEWTYWPDTDFATNWSTSIAGETLPDLFYLSTRGKAEAQSIGEEGLFVDYRELFQYMPHLLDRMKDFPESVPAIQNTDGTIYGLPHIYSTLTAAPGTVYYRTDMFEEAGVEVPTKPEELIDAVEKLQAHFSKEEPDFTAFQVFSAGHMGMLEYLFYPAFGDSVDPGFGADKEGKVQYNFIGEQYQRYLEFASKLFATSGFDKNIYTEDGTNSRAVITENKTAITTFGTIFTEENFKGDTYDVKLFEPFTSEYSSEKKYKMPDVVRYGGMHMSSQVEDKETLAKWLDSLYAKRENPIAEGVWAITPWIGIEGKDWRYTDEEQGLYEITPPDDWDQPETLYINEIGPGNAIGYGRFDGLNTGNIGLKVKGEGTRDQLFPYGVTGFPASYLNFTDEEQRVLNDVYPDIHTYVTDEIPKFISGQRDIAEFDQFKDDVEKMGIQEVLEVYQAAYDRYVEVYGSAE